MVTDVYLAVIPSGGGASRTSIVGAYYQGPRMVIILLDNSCSVTMHEERSRVLSAVSEIRTLYGDNVNIIYITERCQGAPRYLLEERNVVTVQESGKYGIRSSHGRAVQENEAFQTLSNMGNVSISVKLLSPSGDSNDINSAFFRRIHSSARPDSSSALVETAALLHYYHIARSIVN